MSYSELDPMEDTESYNTIVHSNSASRVTANSIRWRILKDCTMGTSTLYHTVTANSIRWRILKALSFFVLLDLLKVTANSIRWRILKEDLVRRANEILMSYSELDPMEDTESWVEEKGKKVQLSLQRTRSDGGY